MKQIEIGGYLPLELNSGCPLFHSIPNHNILAVNTGRTAIWCAIQSLRGSRIHVPVYYCTDVIEMLHDSGMEIVFYHINGQFMPADIDASDDDIVLLVNFYGIMNESICALAYKFKKVILDQSHGYFYEPVFRQGVMNVYSCRKFIGVSDGAYLIGKEIEKIALKQDISYTRITPLCKSIELGTNAGYIQSKENEHALEKKRLKMSILTERLLANTNYEIIIRKRCENFWFLHEKLNELQRLDITEKNVIPYMYPLLLNKDIHEILVSQQIYVPVLWRHLLDKKYDGTLEQHFARYMIPLPVDQRYSQKDMEYLVHAVYSAI